MVNLTPPGQAICSFITNLNSQFPTLRIHKRGPPTPYQTMYKFIIFVNNLKMLVFNFTVIVFVNIIILKKIRYCLVWLTV